MTSPQVTKGHGPLPRSPVTLSELEEMKRTVLFGADDVEHLRLSLDVAKDEVEEMHAAWVKSCLLQVTLWSHAYVKERDS